MNWFRTRTENEVVTGKEDVIPAGREASRRDRLTVSIDESVKEISRAYADRQGTTLSALVEAYLGQVATEGTYPRRRATEEDIRIHDGIPSMTKAGNDILPRSFPADVGTYFATGTLAVNEDNPLSPLAIQFRAILRSRGMEVSQELMVSQDTIRRWNSCLEGNVPRTQSRRETLETQQAHMMNLLAELHGAGVKRFRIVCGRHEASVSAEDEDGRQRTLRSLSADNANDLMIAAFNMADASDSTYRPINYQSARISGTRSPLPTGIGSVILTFSPLVGQGRMMEGVLASSVPGPLDVMAGFCTGQRSAIEDALALDTGLVLVSGHKGSGRSTTLAATLAGGNRMTTLVQGTMTHTLHRDVIPDVAHTSVHYTSIIEEMMERNVTAISFALRSNARVIGVDDLRGRGNCDLILAGAKCGTRIHAVVMANDAHAALAHLLRDSMSPKALACGDFPVTVIWQALFRRMSLIGSETVEEYKGPGRARMIRLLDEAGIDPSVARTTLDSMRPSEDIRRIMVSEVLQPSSKVIETLERDGMEAMRNASREEGFVPARHMAARLVKSGVIDARDALSAFGNLLV